jgi:hypothetical protein
MIQLSYRPSDDCFVIHEGEHVIVATNASDMLARKTRDEAAAAVGLLRFVTFTDWQAKNVGCTLWMGTAEDALERAPRI